MDCDGIVEEFHERNTLSLRIILSLKIILKVQNAGIQGPATIYYNNPPRIPATLLILIFNVLKVNVKFLHLCSRNAVV